MKAKPPGSQTRRGGDPRRKPSANRGVTPVCRPGGQSRHPLLRPPEVPGRGRKAPLRLAGARHPRQSVTAGREQVKSRRPAAPPGLPIPPPRSRLSPEPPPVPAPHGRAPAGGCGGGEPGARRLFASTRKHQQREGGRIGGGEIGRPSGPGSRYRPQRPPSCAVPGLARSPTPPRGSWARPVVSRCPGATGRAGGLRRRLGAGARRGSRREP